MKINRGHVSPEAEAIHVWPAGYSAPPQVGINCGGLFALMTLDEARELATALNEAADKSEAAQAEEATA